MIRVAGSKYRFWLFTFHFELHIRIGHMEFFFYMGNKDVPVNPDILFFIKGNSKYGITVTRDGVVHFPRIKLSQTNRIFLPGVIQETGKNLDGIRTLLVNIITRMSASKSFYRYTNEEQIVCRRALTDFKMSAGADATCATDAYLAFVFAVQIDKQVAGHKVSFHAMSACKTSFFITGKHALYGTMLYIIRCEYCQLHSIAYTVVGSKGSALSLQPFTIDISLNGIFVKIEIHVHQFVTDHIHVTL